MTDREKVARVKPLEWEDYPADDGPVMSKSIALHGTYFIVDDTDDFSGLYLQLISHDNAKWWQHVRSTCDTLLEGIHTDDLGPIKAAAQADYEARILAALEPVTVQEARIREAADNLYASVTEWAASPSAETAKAVIMEAAEYEALCALADTGEDG